VANTTILMTLIDHLWTKFVVRHFECEFYLRDAMLARYLPSSCVRLSVRLSQVGVLLRRLNLGSRKDRPATLDCWWQKSL